MFSTKTSTLIFKSTNGRPIHLHSKSTETSEGGPVSSMITVTYTDLGMRSYLFVGLYPWVLFSLLYAFQKLDNKLLLGSTCLILLSVGVYLHLYKVTKETVLSIRDLGIQTTRTYFTGRETSHFYCSSSIWDVVIEQGFQSHQIVSYVSALINIPEEKLKAIPLMYPNMEEDGLKLIYNEINSVMF